MPSELGLKAEQDFARLVKWWDNGGKLHRVCESPEIICKILGVCDQLGRGSIALTRLTKGHDPKG